MLELALDLRQLALLDLDDRALEATACPGEVVDEQEAEEDDVDEPGEGVA